MLVVTAWIFDTPGGAAQALATLTRLSRDELVNVYDAAVVEWRPGARRPQTRPATDLVGEGALGSAYWGLTLGLLIYVPLISTDIRRDPRTSEQLLADIGLDHCFVTASRTGIRAGTSALFSLSNETMRDAIAGSLADTCVDSLMSSVASDTEQALRMAFAGD